MTASLRLDDRVAVVTGAGAGIGRALAIGLAEAGAEVTVFDIDEAAVTQTAKEIRAAGGTAWSVIGDVSDRHDLAQLAQQLEGRHGRLDLLVNNAAVEGAPHATPLSTLTDDAFDRVMAVNVKGMWLAAQAFSELLERSGTGSIVNLGSIGAFFVTGGYLPYVTSKAAVIGLTKSLAKELGPRGIRVNSLAPGSTATESVRAATPPDVVAQIVSGQAIGGHQQPADLVDPVLFLASEASRFITGQTIVVDGGFVMLP